MKKQKMKSKPEKTGSGYTPGMAEGDEETIEKALRNQESKNKKSSNSR